MAVIFDMDGTIADVEHRRHHVLDRENANWAAFNDAMGSDTPKADIVRLLEQLGARNQIVITTGRHEKYRRVTETWLAFNRVEVDAIYMRADDDQRADHIIKLEMLAQIRADGFQPWLVIDDRDSVVRMWRDQGLTCLQCDYGDF